MFGCYLILVVREELGEVMLVNLFGEGARLDVRSQHPELDGTVRYEGDGLAYWCNQDIF